MSIIYRLEKGSPLTHAELDGNFQFLTGSINNILGTYATTSSNTFNGNQTIYGNLDVFGTASFSFTTSSITELSSSIFGINIESPVIRFGQYDVYDTGNNYTSSLMWDSLNKYWIYSDISGSSINSALLLTGPINTSSLGNEQQLTQFRVPRSNGTQSLVNSNIFTSGSITIITGSLQVTQTITGSLQGTSSWSNNSLTSVNSTQLGGLPSNSFVRLLTSQSISGIKTFNNGLIIGNIDGENIGSITFNELGGENIINIQNQNGNLNILNANDDVLLNIDQNGGGIEVLGTIIGNLNGNVNGNLVGSASYALTSSLSNTSLSSSYALSSLSSSYALSSLSSSYALNSLFLNNTSSNVFATTGSNTFKGEQILSGSIRISNMFNKEMVNISSSFTSSIDIIVTPTTQSNTSTLTLDILFGSFEINSDFIIGITGVSGSTETAIESYNVFDTFYSGVSGFSIQSTAPVIQLSPDVNLDYYKIWIYNSGSVGEGWYFTEGVSGDDLINGYTIFLSGDTDGFLSNDLLSQNFQMGDDPNSITNSVVYVSESLNEISSSIVNIDSDLIITGSLYLNDNGISSGLYINGKKQFNYISLYNTSSITPTQNVSGAFTYNNVNQSNGIELISGSKITFSNNGIYNITVLGQIFTQTGATIDLWLKKDGLNVPNSAIKIGPTSNNTHLVSSYNITENINSGSYIELMYQSNQSNTQFQFITASGNIPAAPSIHANVIQIA
jgi:hypothetical protein